MDESGRAVDAAESIVFSREYVAVRPDIHADERKEIGSSGRAVIAILLAEVDVVRADTGEVRDDAGRQVHLADAAQTKAREVKRVRLAVDGKGHCEVDLRASGGPAVAIGAVFDRCSVAGDG